MYVARLRHIQATHEPPERRNPDTLVRHFLPLLQRLHAACLGQKALSQLRSDPFYYYLVARTRHYDQVVIDAVSNGIQRLIIIGCGSDTRAYRFKDLLGSKGVKVLECDQTDAIHAKRRLARRLGRRLDFVEYMPIDLNDTEWPELEGWLGGNADLKTLVLMEGVSPYVNDSNFGQFLRFLAKRLAAGSRVAYDFKIMGVKDEFGRNGRTQRPFRLPAASDQIAAFHEERGFRQTWTELSSELGARLMPVQDNSVAPRFKEDGLVQLQLDRT